MTQDGSAEGWIAQLWISHFNRNLQKQDILGAECGIGSSLV